MTSSCRTSAAARALVAAVVACALAPAASAQAVVATPPVVTAFFSQDAATPGIDVGVGFAVANPNVGVPMTGVGFSVALPAGLVISTPSQLSTTCDGTVAAADGGTTISVSGASLPAADDEAGNSCAVLLDVVTPAPGVVSVQSGPATSAESGPGSASNIASLRVLALPTIAEAFDKSSIKVGESARVTFTMSNPNASERLYNLAFNDVLPAGLAVAALPNVAATCATDGVVADPGATTISLLGLTVEAASQCTLSVDVTGTAATVSPNPTGPLSFSYDAGGGDLRAVAAAGGSATLVVVAPPALAAAFGSPTIAPGATTTLTFTLTNPNPALTLTGIAFSGTLPSGLSRVLSLPSTDTCAGVPPPVAIGGYGVGSVTLAPGAGCVQRFSVTGATPGRYATTTSAVSSVEAGAGAPASATLTIANPPPPPPPPPPPGAPGLPSNAFKVTKVSAAADGSVRFDVAVAGPGEVGVLETLGASSLRVRKPGPNRFTVARKSVKASKAGTLHVKVTLNARGKQALRRAKKTLRLNLWVSFRPTGGRAGTAVRKTVLIRHR